ncbi:MAG: DUF1127 domain-containing protein [Gammaproteobacteria bacterium]
MATLATLPADSAGVRVEECSLHSKSAVRKLLIEAARWFGGMQARAELRDLSDATLADVGLRRDGSRVVPFV